MRRLRHRARATDPKVGRKRWQDDLSVLDGNFHQGELYPRVGFLVTNLTRPAERVVKFYNGRGTAEQWIKEGKQALRWTRLSCRAFRDNAVRLQLFALAYNLANFLRSLALPNEVAQWSHRPGAGHLEGGQSQAAHHHDRAGLVVAQVSAGVRIEPLVSRARARPSWPHSSDCDRRAGAQAVDRALAVCQSR